MDDIMLNSYLKDNEQLYKNLIDAKKYIKRLGKKLKEIKINIFDYQWYKNLFELYIPMACEYYNFCKNNSMSEINKENDKWMRLYFKSFISDVEKFIRFISKMMFNKEAYKFGSAIEDLQKELNMLIISNIPSDVIPRIKYNLTFVNNWRELSNPNKHDAENHDESYYIAKSKIFIKGEALVQNGNDILDYVSTFTSCIVNEFLQLLLAKKYID